MPPWNKDSRISAVRTRVRAYVDATQLKIYIFVDYGILIALQDGKSGHTLIHNRDMKGNGLNTALMS